MQRSELQKTDPNRIVRFNAFHLDIVTGRAEANGNPMQKEPRIMLRWSDDGETWSKTRLLSLGRQGQRSQRVHARRLGALRRGSQGRTWEVSCSDPHVVATAGTAQVDIS